MLASTGAALLGITQLPCLQPAAAQPRGGQAPSAAAVTSLLQHFCITRLSRVSPAQIPVHTSQRCEHRAVIPDLCFLPLFPSSSEAICRLSLSCYGSSASISALGTDLIKWLLQIQIDRNTHITFGYGCRDSPRGLEVCFPLQEPCQSLPIIPIITQLL